MYLKTGRSFKNQKNLYLLINKAKIPMQKLFCVLGSKSVVIVDLNEKKHHSELK